MTDATAGAMTREEYERRVMASIFGTPEAEVAPMIAHFDAQHAQLAAARGALENSTNLLRQFTGHWANEDGMVDEQITENHAALAAIGKGATG